jgi:O-antigen/teichoic acid export membrane protein
MGIVVRQSLKTLFTTYIGLAIGYFNTLWLYPLFLTKEEIGLTRLLISVSFLFAIFASLGSINIPNKFFPYFNDKEKRHNGFLFFLLMLGSVGFVIFAVLFFAFKDLVYSIYIQSAPLLLNYYYYFLPLTLLALYYSIFESYLIIQQKPVLPNFVREVLLRISITIGLLSIFFGLFSFNGFVLFLMFSMLLGLLLLVFYSQREGILFIRPDLSVFRSSYLKGIFVYGGFVLLGNSSSLLIGNIDALMLSAYKGLGATGIYTIAFFVANVIEIPKRSISQSVIGIVSVANKNKDYFKLETLYKKSSINQLIPGVLIFLGIWCNVENIFQLMPNSEIYIAGKWVVFFIGLSKLFDMATGVNAEILSSSDYYKADLVFLVILGLTAIVTNIIFIPIWGIIGAALASAMSIFMVNSIRFIFILWKFKIQPFSLNTIKVLLIGLFVLAVNYLLPFLGNIILDIIIRSIVILLIFGTSVLIFKTSEDIDVIFRGIWEQIFNSNK